MIFQDPYASLDPHQKVYDIIAEGIQIHGMAKNKTEEKKMVAELLEMVGLNAEHAARNVHELPEHFPLIRNSCFVMSLFQHWMFRYRHRL